MLIRGKPLRVFSSVGLERYLDRVEVIGSNPITPTFIPSVTFKISSPLGFLDFRIPHSPISNMR